MMMNLHSPTVADIARQIDQHFDAMLYAGMDLERAREIEAERASYHAYLTKCALEAAAPSHGFSIGGHYQS